jgi:hypothetical protein
VATGKEVAACEPTTSTPAPEQSVELAASSRIEAAKRLTKEENRARLLQEEVEFHYFRDNDASGAVARINAVHTDDGYLQTTVTRTVDETAKFLSHKEKLHRYPGVRSAEQADQEKLGSRFLALREQLVKQLALTAASDEMPKWLQDAMELDSQEKTMPAMDILFDNIDGLLTAGRFDEVDQIFLRVPLEGPSLTFLMGILTTTMPAGDRLPSRARFFDRLYRLCKAMGRDAEDLLGGLRRWSGADGSGLLGR